MKFFNILILILPLTFFAEEITYEEGDSFESTKSRSVVLYEYKADASKVNTALRFAFNVEEFVEYRGESEWVEIDSTPITFYIADHQDQFDTLEIIEL